MTRRIPARAWTAAPPTSSYGCWRRTVRGSIARRGVTGWQSETRPWRRIRCRHTVSAGLWNPASTPPRSLPMIASTGTTSPGSTSTGRGGRSMRTYESEPRIMAVKPGGRTPRSGAAARPLRPASTRSRCVDDRKRLNACSVWRLARVSGRSSRASRCSERVRPGRSFSSASNTSVCLHTRQPRSGRPSRSPTSPAGESRARCCRPNGGRTNRRTRAERPRRP
jgi:hypothetical protein